MGKEASRRQQEAYGTYHRNQMIKVYRRMGISLAEIGRMQNPSISRQRVHKLVHRGDGPGWFQQVKKFFGG